MPAATRLLIISGLSGSGKSVALHVLEDLGYYCIDNLPAVLLNSLINEVTQKDKRPEPKIAVSIDARNRQSDLDVLPGLIDPLRTGKLRAELLFMQATDDILLKRYSETRRRHPLAKPGTELRNAIERERLLLGPVINAADLVIDTSRSSVYQLAETIRDRVDQRQSDMLSVLVESFGFKNGIPVDADFVFDLRCLPNPYWEPSLREMTGKSKAVAKFLDDQPLCDQMFADISQFLKRWIPEYLSFDRSYLTIALGCTGGQHRSVYMTEKLASALGKIHHPVLVRHNELPSDSGGTA